MSCRETGQVGGEECKGIQVAFGLLMGGEDGSAGPMIDYF